MTAATIRVPSKNLRKKPSSRLRSASAAKPFHLQFPRSRVMVERESESLTGSFSLPRQRREAETVFVASLGSDDIRLRRPLFCIVEREDTENFIAECPDVGMFASGDSSEECIENLQDVIATRYRMFSNLGREKLSPAIQRQLDTLEAHMRD